MSEVGFILLSALLLGVPIGVKYLLAFQTRHLVDTLKRQERKVQLLSAQLEAIKQESIVTGRAVRQMNNQRCQAQTRRAMIEEELGRVRRSATQEQLIAV